MHMISREGEERERGRRVERVKGRGRERRSHLKSQSISGTCDKTHSGLSLFKVLPK